MKITEIDTANLIIKLPKKYDDSYICKIKYKSDQDASKLVIDFGLVQLLQMKSGSVMLKATKESMKKMLEIQEKVVEYAKDNVSKWFGHKVQHHLIEDMFIGSVHIHEKHGKVLKLRTTSPVEESIKMLKADLQVKLESVRFQRNSFNMLWEVVACTEQNEEEYMFAEESESESDDSSLEEFDDYHEILQTLKSELASKITNKRNQIQMIEEQLVLMESTIDQSSLSEIEALSNKVDTIKIENIFSNNNIIV